MIRVEIEVDDCEYRRLQFVSAERGRTAEEEIRAALAAFLADPAYLSHVEDEIRRDLEGDEWKFQGD